MLKLKLEGCASAQHFTTSSSSNAAAGQLSQMLPVKYFLSESIPMSTFREIGDMMKGDGFYSEKKTGGDIMAPMSYLTSLDLIETDQEYKVISDIPGVDPSNNLAVWLDGRSLCIKAKRNETYGDIGTKLHKQNIAYGEVERHVRLPKNAALDQAKSEYKNGVLSVCFPKLATEVEPEHRRLTVDTA